MCIIYKGILQNWEAIQDLERLGVEGKIKSGKD